jgi:hypothetical protein
MFLSLLTQLDYNKCKHNHHVGSYRALLYGRHGSERFTLLRPALMTKLQRNSSNNSSKYSWGAGSCFSRASTVVDCSNQSDFYTDQASFSQDPSTTSTLLRLLTKITSLFSSDRSETISDISSTEGIPHPEGTRDPPNKRLQRRSTQRKVISKAPDSHAGEVRAT